MSWSTMSAELQGQTPIPPGLGLILVNRAWKDVQREYMWSFRWLDFSIPTPSMTNAGTVTLVRGSTTVVADASAVAAWLAIPLVTPITGQQFRIGQGTLYNIIAFDGVNTITLDRAYVDTPSGAGNGYQIYQCYYNAPVKNFIWFETVRDPVTGYSIKTTTTRQEASDTDPQRLQVSWPDSVLPYRINQNPGAFYGFPMYEIWPAPLNGLTYVAEAYLRELDFDNTNPGFSDSVIPPLGEDVVMELAKQKAYEWCIANPDKVPRGDFRYVHGECKVEYKRLINQYIQLDEAFSKRNLIPYAEKQDSFPSDPYISMLANLAVFPG